MVDFKKLLADSRNLRKQSEPFPCAIVSGSYKYGRPTIDSDIDLIILCSPEDRELLRVLFSDENEMKFALRFGKLNLICCESEAQFEAWVAGTERLVKEKPVTRERAIEVLSEEREKREFKQDYDEQKIKV